MPKRNSKHLTEPGIAKMARAPKGGRIERFDSSADGLCLRITDRTNCDFIFLTWNLYWLMFYN